MKLIAILAAVMLGACATTPVAEPTRMSCSDYTERAAGYVRVAGDALAAHGRDTSAQAIGELMGAIDAACDAYPNESADHAADVILNATG